MSDGPRVSPELATADIEIPSTIQTIVLPLDGSEFAERALPVAARLARALDADVHLFSAVSHPEDVGQREAYFDALAARCGRVRSSVVVDADPAQCDPWIRRSDSTTRCCACRAMDAGGAPASSARWRARSSPAVRTRSSSSVPASTTSRREWGRACPAPASWRASTRIQCPHPSFRSRSDGRGCSENRRSSSPWPNRCRRRLRALPPTGISVRRATLRHTSCRCSRPLTRETLTSRRTSFGIRSAPRRASAATSASGRRRSSSSALAHAKVSPESYSAAWQPASSVRARHRCSSLLGPTSTGGPGTTGIAPAPRRGARDARPLRSRCAPASRRPGSPRSR